MCGVWCAERQHTVRAVGLELDIQWPPPPARQTGKVNVKPREKQKQGLLQQILVILSGMNNVNKKKFVFRLSAQRGLL